MIWLQAKSPSFSNKFMLRLNTVNITESSTKSLAVLPGTKCQMLLSSKQPHTMKYFWKHFSEKWYSTFKTKEKKMQVMFRSAKPNIWVSLRILIPLMLKPVPSEVPLNLKQCYMTKNTSFNTYSKYLRNHIMRCLYSELTVGVKIFP